MRNNNVVQPSGEQFGNGIKTKRDCDTQRIPLCVAKATLELRILHALAPQTIICTIRGIYLSIRLGLEPVWRLNQVPKVDWLGKPSCEAISFTVNVPLRSSLSASSRRCWSIHSVVVRPEVCFTQMLSRLGVMFSCRAYQSSECCWRKCCSTKCRISLVLAESYIQMFPPRSSVRAFWWRVFLLSLHQDLPFKIPGGGFTLIHSTKITRGEISGGKLSFYRTTKTSRREISGGGLPVVAPPRSPEERILVECFLRSHHQNLPKRDL